MLPAVVEINCDRCSCLEAPGQFIMNCTLSILRKMKVAALIALVGMMFTACERKGPAEEVGEAVDEAAEGVRDAFD
jgi:hypothetical protein